MTSVNSVSGKKRMSKKERKRRARSVKTTYTYFKNKEKLRALPRLQFRTSEGKVTFLIDTGAVASFLTTKFQNTCKFRDHEIPEEFSAANGIALKLHGSITLQIEICEDVLSHTFLVADVGTNLMGFDFLSEHKLVLLHDPVRLEKYVPQPSRVFTINAVQENVGLSTRKAPYLVDRMCYTVDARVMKETNGRIATQSADDLAELRKDFPYVFRDKDDSMRKKRKPIIRMPIDVVDGYRCSKNYDVPHSLQEHVIMLCLFWKTGKREE